MKIVQTQRKKKRQFRLEKWDEHSNSLFKGNGDTSWASLRLLRTLTTTTPTKQTHTHAINISFHVTPLTGWQLPLRIKRQTDRPWYEPQWNDKQNRNTYAGDWNYGMERNKNNQKQKKKKADTRHMSGRKRHCKKISFSLFESMIENQSKLKNEWRHFSDNRSIRELKQITKHRMRRRITSIYSHSTPTLGPNRDPLSSGIYRSKRNIFVNTVLRWSWRQTKQILSFIRDWERRKIAT